MQKEKTSLIPAPTTTRDQRQEMKALWDAMQRAGEFIYTSDYVHHGHGTEILFNRLCDRPKAFGEKRAADMHRDGPIHTHITVVGAGMEYFAGDTEQDRAFFDEWYDSPEHEKAFFEDSRMQEHTHTIPRGVVAVFGENLYHITGRDVPEQGRIAFFTPD